MVTESRWIVNDEAKNQITRASTLKPRLDYAAELVDEILDILNQKKFDLNKNNLKLYEKTKESKYSLTEFEKQLSFQSEISWAVESLRQVRRCLDSVFGLGNIILVLAPTISIGRIIRSQMLGIFPAADSQFGELSLVLGGLIIDAGQLTNANLDFDLANRESSRLLDEAKLIVDSKIYKQFPNVDLS
jgi:hypothetical protein